MTSEEHPEPEVRRRDEAGKPAGQQAESLREADGDPRGSRGRLKLTDPKAIRALAHPMRWALLEALGDAGTLTATQASDMLGESPANCAFHLRTLAKYGFVEEAGGGRGRERPWRQTYDGMSWQTRQEDPEVSHAGEALDQVWMDRMLTRARRSLTSTGQRPLVTRPSRIVTGDHHHRWSPSRRDCLCSRAALSVASGGGQRPGWPGRPPRIVTGDPGIGLVRQETGGST
jgi:hypothetical protein